MSETFVAGIATADPQSQNIIMLLQSIGIARHFARVAAAGCDCGKDKECALYIDAMILDNLYSEIATNIAEFSGAFAKPGELHS